MINFRSARFAVSAPTVADRPKDGKPSILMVGRSNVGKSTLINGVLGQRIAFASKKAGKTKLLNYFLVDDTFYLVDAPGYGSTDYATMSTIQFSKMMEDCVKDPLLKGMAVLLDFRRTPGKDDVAFLRYLVSTGKEMIVILTKCDQMNQSERHKARMMASELGFTQILESDQSPRSVEKIRAALASVATK